MSISSSDFGKQFIFNYPKEFTSLPGYNQRRGATVVLNRELIDGEEYDKEDGERMFEIQDGKWIGHAYESELSPLS